MALEDTPLSEKPTFLSSAPTRMTASGMPTLALSDNDVLPPAPGTPRVMVPKVRSKGNRSVRQYRSGSMRTIRAVSGTRSPAYTQYTLKDVKDEIDSVPKVDESSSNGTSMAVRDHDEDDEVLLSDSDIDSMDMGSWGDDEEEEEGFLPPPDDQIHGIHPTHAAMLPTMHGDYGAEQSVPKDTSMDISTSESLEPDFSRDMLGALPTSKGRFPTRHRANDRKYVSSNAVGSRPSSRVKNARITKDRDLTGPFGSKPSYTYPDVDNVLESVRLREKREKKSHKKSKSLLMLERLNAIEDWVPLVGGQLETPEMHVQALEKGGGVEEATIDQEAKGLQNPKKPRSVPRFLS